MIQSTTAARANLGILWRDLVQEWRPHTITVVDTTTVELSSPVETHLTVTQTQIGRRFASPASASGLNYFINLLRGGTPEGEALAAMLGSQEYWDRKGGNRRVFIKGLYNDILHRNANSQEIQGWEVRMDALDDDRQALAQEFLQASLTELQGRPW